MAGMQRNNAGSGDQDDEAASLDFDVTSPHPARVYNYLLGVLRHRP